MADVMLTIVFGEQTPSIESAAAILGVPISVFNQRFGVVLIEPTTSKYVVLLDEIYANNVSKDSRIEGPFSNPKISQ